MKMTGFKKLLSFTVCLVLIAAIALSMTGCNGKADTISSEVSTNEVASQTETTAIGQGEKSFDFTVTDLDGKETSFKVSTDKKTVGEALLELELIAGEDSTYGLYVKTVNGTTLDYDKDGKYWAFYENGSYASKGVDLTEITDGASYAFKAE